MTKLVVIFMLFVPLGSARADAPLDLAAAQAEARSQAPDVDALDALVRGADATARDAGRRFRTDPELSLDYSTAAISGEAAEQAIGAGLSWTVDLTSAPRHRRDAAVAGRDRAGFDRADGLRALDEAVAIAMADLVFAQRQLARAETLAGLFDASSALTQRRGASGAATLPEIDAAALDAIGARADVARARGDVEHARIGLARLLGRATHAGLVAADPAEPVDARAPASMPAADDPRIAAVAVGVRGADSEVRLAHRSVFSSTTLGIDLGWASHGIPAGAFMDPSVTARWKDWEIGVKVAVPIPLVDRRREERTQATARRDQAEAAAATTRADVATAIATARADLATASDVWKQMAPSAEILDRAAKLLARAFETGAIDAVESAQALRRLVESGRRLDQAVRDLRIARARWERQTAR